MKPLNPVERLSEVQSDVTPSGSLLDVGDGPEAFHKGVLFSRQSGIPDDVVEGSRCSLRTGTRVRKIQGRDFGATIPALLGCQGRRAPHPVGSADRPVCLNALRSQSQPGLASGFFVSSYTLSANPV